MAAQPPFALHPADAIPGVIDLTTQEGIKLYQNATCGSCTDSFCTITQMQKFGLYADRPPSQVMPGGHSLQETEQQTCQFL